VRGGGWPLPLLQEKVDQFVLHYDVCGTSRQCFNILHDHRGLSVHFMLDLDGTIYQTLDLKERAWHATTSNDRSIGIEIANIGAYGKGGEGGDTVLDQWYRKDADGHTRVVIPWALGGGRFLRTPDFIARPAREEAVVGDVQGHTLRMYDLTPQQYDSLIKLTATLCSVFPKITCDYPRDENGKLITHKLAPDQLTAYHGVLGHYHVQTDKTDPGPALQWDKVIEGAKALMETRGQGDKGTRG
jgi:N-acetyl-anhydromuramyl-L-alanine amidase AmpD